MRSRGPMDSDALAALQDRAKGAGFRHKGQCALCHGKVPGERPQGFPVGKGVIAIAGYKVCRRHAGRLSAIAAAAGIVWPAPACS